MRNNLYYYYNNKNYFVKNYIIILTKVNDKKYNFANKFF